MMFLHYCGHGAAGQLAASFRAALDQLSKGKPAGMMKGMKH